MTTATITAKGQITIPAEIREALGLDAGDRISFEEIAPGKYSFVPVQKHSVRVLKGMFGRASKSVSIDEMNAAIAKRGESAK
ncbi:MAG: AbrB/MazE/SpoVT family DNA-binding domain-containing protein [Aestuariivirga sp.]